MIDARVTSKHIHVSFPAAWFALIVMPSVMRPGCVSAEGPLETMRSGQRAGSHKNTMEKV